MPGTAAQILLVAVYVVAAAVIAVACSRIAARRGRNPTAWAVLGVVFPLAAVIAVAVLPPPRRDGD